MSFVRIFASLSLRHLLNIVAGNRRKGPAAPLAFAMALCGMLAADIATAPAQVNVYTKAYDLGRSGANLNETILTPANVNPTNFGKLYTVPTDGQVYAQPLFVSGLQIAGAIHDTVFVSSMMNSIYAIDAPTGQILWQQNYGTPVIANEVDPSHNIAYGTTVGILSTPVIDPLTKYMYFVTANESIVSGTNIYKFVLHEIDIRTGDVVVAPVEITATYSTADLTNPLVFTPFRQNQRAGLVLANGNVYFAFASHDDRQPYSGWVMSYNATTLQQVAVYSDTTIGIEGGIWGAGSAPTVDAAGDIYISTGNGSFGATPNGLMQTGNSFIKLSPQLQLLDYFTPTNSARLNAGDQDLGSSGLLLIPDTNYIIGGGKQGVLYLADVNNLGKFDASEDHVRQEFQAVYGVGTSHIHGNPTYFDSDVNGPSIFVWGENDMLRGFQFNVSTGLVTTTPFAKSTMTAPVTNNNGAMPGGFTSISANGKTNGIVWASTPFNGDSQFRNLEGVLYAFDANTLQPLWSDKTQEARDEVGLFAKHVQPIVANGRMFIPTFGSLNNTAGTGQLVVYGLLPVLTINIADANMVSGAAVPTLKGAVSGLSSSDTLGGSVVVTYSTTATSTSPAGTYPITATVSGTSAIHYKLVVNAGTLTVTAPAVLAPALSLAGGTFYAPQTITISDGTAGASIYYTLNGAAPSTASTLYTNDAITITATTTLKAIASLGGKLSSVSTANYTITSIAAPVILPGGGNYAGPQTVTIIDSTSGASIFYTLDGSTPSASSTPYTGGFSVASTATLKAVAIVGSVKGPVSTAAYTISPTSSGVSYGSGFTGAGLQLNGSAVLVGSHVQLTNTVNQAGSVFSTTAVNVQKFTNDFTFQLPTPTADGITFVIQSQGVNAVGSLGYSLGYGGTSAVPAIGHSVAVKFDVYNNVGEGVDSTGIYTNGAQPWVPATDLTSTGVNLRSGNVFHTHMTYDGATLLVTITDTVTGATASQSYAVNIPNVVGTNTAYVGFTGGTGTLAALQNVLTWAYSPAAAAAVVPPALSLASGTFYTPQTVTLSDATAGASIYYTLNGTAPSSASTLYNGTAIPIAANTTLNAIASLGGQLSSVSTATYTIAAITAPAISPGTGSYAASQTITITDATSGASIFYTLDGSTPSASSIPYTAGFSVASTTTVKAIAIIGSAQSPVSVATYTITATPPPPDSGIGYGTGFTGTGLQLNGSAVLSGSHVQLTNAVNQAGSVYSTTTVNVQKFTNDFTFQLPTPTADGITFVIQNQGLNAVGSLGYSLGYGGTSTVSPITHSVAVKFDVYNNVGEGVDSTGIYTNGAQPWVPSTNLTSTGVNLRSGNIFHAHMTYDGTTLLVTITDTVTGTTASQSYTVNIPNVIGANTAYVGFTGGTGVLSAPQNILTWTYSPTLAVTTVGYGSGFTATGLHLNGSAVLSGSHVQLTNAVNQAGSVYSTTAVNVQKFTNDFTFQLPTPTADGITFVIQNQSLNAVGSLGYSLGYGGTSTVPPITRSVAVKFDVYNNVGEGVDSTGIYTNGAQPWVPGTDLTSTGVNLRSGNIFRAHMTYDGTTLLVTLTDTVTGATASQSYTVNIPNFVGANTAYVGFTGGTGTLSAPQNVLTWMMTTP